MTEIETFAADISQYASTAQVTTDPDALRHYAIDGLLPRIVVTPATVEQVAQVVALTSQHGLTLMARGG
jgi:FAD/FMN-containing dehydrogenase